MIIQTINLTNSDTINSVTYNHTTATTTTTTGTTTDVCITKLKPVKSNSHVFQNIFRHFSTVAVEVMPI